MSEVVEISSDSSSDTIITPIEGEKFKCNSFENALSAFNEIDGLLNKYGSVENVHRNKVSGVSKLETCSETVATYSGTLPLQDSLQNDSTVSSITFQDTQVSTEDSPRARKEFTYVLSDSEEELYVPLETQPKMPHISKECRRSNSESINAELQGTGNPSARKKFKYVLSDSEEELIVPSEKQLKLPDISKEYRRSNSQSNDAESQGTRFDIDSQHNLQTGPPPKQSRKASKEDKEVIRLEKQRTKQQKKEEIQREKAIKQAIQNANRNLKPDQAMKFIKVHLDHNIMKSDFCHDIKVALDNLEIVHTFQSQVIPDIITWTREVQCHDINETGKIGLSKKNVETDELLMVLNWRNVVELVSKGSLVSHIQSVKSVYPNKKISVTIFGLQRYYNYQKNFKRTEFRSEMTDAPQGNVKDSTMFKDVPIVTKQEIESLLTELQILCNLSCRSLETNLDVGLFVAQFSKAVAQLPYKLEKHKKEQEASWYMLGDNKDCVKVDKDGNGLNRLWHQQLTTFPLARLETAEAIATKYPTPLTLMQAYGECSSEEQAQALLQDIAIRRAAGLTTVRKIGPEMSRKIYKFFISLDGETLL